MNSFQLIAHIQNFLNAIQGQKYFLETVNNFPKIHKKLLEDSLSIIRENRSDYSGREANNALDKKYSTLKTELQSVKSRQIFTSINNLEHAVMAFAKGNGGAPQIQGIAKNILEGLSNFSTAYESYLNTLDGAQKEDTLLVLLIAGNDLSIVLDSTQSVLNNIKEKLQGQALNFEKSGYERFSLFSETHVDFRRFSEKLYSINIIYLELCGLLNISPNDYPMIIVKVESGSSWTEVLAYPKIVSLLTSMIENTVDYFYRTFTREGKIVTLPRKVEAVEEILELRKKLAVVGIDTTKIDDELAKSTFVIADELNKLLLGEHKVVINNRVMSIETSFEKKYLEASKKFLLPMLEQEPPQNVSGRKSG